jgi:hypothetical protein
MEKKNSGKRLFSGMSYRDVQRSNSNRREHLPKKDQNWLKENGYKNIGWENVIKLYQKINDFLSSSDPDEPSLEELFLRADQIGNKYQNPEEIEAFNQTLRIEVGAIADEIDKQFPDEEVEFVDYSQQPYPSSKAKKTRKRKK